MEKNQGKKENLSIRFLNWLIIIGLLKYLFFVNLMISINKQLKIM